MVEGCFIVVVTYNAEGWLDSCLGNFKAKGVLHRVIIVDNGSSDGTLEKIRREYPQANLFPQNRNIGFGQANNEGIRSALKMGAECILLLNQDAKMEVEALKELISVMQSSPGYGIISPLHLSRENTLDKNFQRYVEKDTHLRADQLFAPTANLPEIVSIPYINAAIWLLSRDCVEKVGGFDPLYFHYGEDNDYANRVCGRGFKIGVCPGIHGFHYRDLFPREKKYRPKKYFNRVKRIQLMELKNISYSFLGNLFRVWSLVAKMILFQLKKWRPDKAFILILSHMSVLADVPIVYSHYTKSKKGLSPFL